MSSKDAPSLDEFAARLADEPVPSPIDDLPDDIKRALLESDVPPGVAAKWLREVHGLDWVKWQQVSVWRLARRSRG